MNKNILSAILASIALLLVELIFIDFGSKTENRAPIAQEEPQKGDSTQKQVNIKYVSTSQQTQKTKKELKKQAAPKKKINPKIMFAASGKYNRYFLELIDLTSKKSENIDFRTPDAKVIHVINNKDTLLPCFPKELQYRNTKLKIINLKTKKAQKIALPDFSNIPQNSSVYWNINAQIQKNSKLEVKEQKKYLFWHTITKIRIKTDEKSI